MIASGQPIFQFRGPFGVPVEIHSSILILALIFVGVGGSVESLKYNLIFVALLVGSIFLHEVGHAWGCEVQRVPVRRIVIYGGGGFCEQKRAASRSEQELIVAMGPIVNLTIWAVSALIWPHMTPGDAMWVLYSLAQINLFLAVLNLLPVQPLDGGKLFHLALLRILPARDATRMAGAVGLVLAILWIPAMLLSFLTLGLVLFFIPSIRAHWEMLRI